VKELENSVEGGFEPHILAGPGIDGNEWFYIDSPTGLGSGESGNLWISKDGGETWEKKNTGRQSINLGGSGDSYTAVASDGTIYYTDLYLVTVTVDVSYDGGETFIQNPQASVVPIDDRQWLGIGPSAGFSPGSETLYLSYNQIPGGLYIQRAVFTPAGFAWVPGNFGRPVTTDVGSRDYFVVDHNDGTLFLPNFNGDQLEMFISTDGANTFTRTEVFTPDSGDNDPVQNIFTAVDVDNAGNVYLIWCNKAHVFMSVSEDRGQSWRIFQVTNTTGTRVLPWIAAGDSGRVGLTWYETPAEGDSDIEAEMEGANWTVEAAICVDALSEDPTFLLTTVQENVHTGTIRTSGVSGEADRDLGDFFTCDVEEKGRLILTYGVDGDDGPNTYQARVIFSRQIDGPYMLENVGPIAIFTNETNELEVTVDASESHDLGGVELVEYIWDWGDGQNSTGITSIHTYEKEGEYNITLKVVNADGLTSKLKEKIDIKEKEEGINPLFLGAGLLILLIAIVIAYLRHRKKSTKHETGA
jgi:PKD repeat protein